MENKKCEICGNLVSELHKHHKIALENGGGNDRDNLMSICSDCHFQIHNEDKKDGDISKQNIAFQNAINENVFSEGWGIIPNKILHDKNISAFAKILYCEISSLCSQKGFCWASNFYLAEKFGKSKTTISGTLTQLEPYLIFRNRASGLRKIYVHSLNKDIPKRKFKGNIKENCKGNLKENCKHNNTIINNKDNNISNKVAGMIKHFEKLDAKNRRYYGNKTQREACEFLLEEHGFDKVEKIIDLMVRLKGEKFLPVITSPYEMVEKWSKLENFFRSKKAEQEEVSNNVVW